MMLYHLEVTTFNIAMRVFEQSGQWELVVRLLRKMEEHGLRPDLFSGFASFMSLKTSFPHVSHVFLTYFD